LRFKIKITWKGVKKFLKMLLKAMGISLILTSLIVCLVMPFYTASRIERMLGIMYLRIGVMDLHYNMIYRDVTNLMVDGFLTIFENETHQNDFNKIVTETKKKQIEFNQQMLNITTTMQENIEVIVKRLKLKHNIDLAHLDEIKEANIIVRNRTSGYQGAGSHIKINETSYILTCEHLMGGKTDKMVGLLGEEREVKLEIVKYDKKKDIMLLKPVENLDIAHFEISKVAPKEGSEVIAVGNPNAMVDVITEGVVADITEEHYTVTNLIYFGNSGGSILYKGKIVGVVTNLRIYYGKNVFVNYGYANTLETINEFLKGIE